MFNKRVFQSRIGLFLTGLLIIFSCEEAVVIDFGETVIESDEMAVIEIRAPRAEGDSLVSMAINSGIDGFIIEALSFEQANTEGDLDQAIKQFDSVYASFKESFEENSLVWEAIIEGEVTYQSEEIISIAMNSYMNTGGAHGNMIISFLNFDARTGEVIPNTDLISDAVAFQDLAKKHFLIKMEKPESEQDFKDYFFGEDFHLPANMGLSDEGPILLYNVYEIASYAQGITEIIIPFEEALPYLVYR